MAQNRIKNTFRAAIGTTIPVFMGYIPLGMAFGLLLAAQGYGVGWAFFMSVIIFAGSGQIFGVSLLAMGTKLPQVAVLTLVLNLRHVVYGLSMFDKFRNMGWRKPYMIFSLTDETYALLASEQAPDGVVQEDYFFAIALLDHCYWILGSVLGAALGGALGAIPQGVEFAMTALFLVIVIGQWQTQKDHIPALLGFGAALLSRMVFGAGNEMLLGALFLIVLVLAIRKPAQQPMQTQMEQEGRA